MSSFLYRMGRLLARQRRWVVVAWLAVLVIAGTGAMFNKGTDDTFTVPGTQSQDTLDYLGRVFPQVSGTSAQLVIVAPPGTDVRAIAAAPTAEAATRIAALDQVAAVINPFDPTAGNTAPAGGPSPECRHRSRPITAPRSSPPSSPSPSPRSLRRPEISSPPSAMNSSNGSAKERQYT